MPIVDQMHQVADLHIAPAVDRLGAAEAQFELIQPEPDRGWVEPERRQRMNRIRALAESRGLAFSCCREGMPELNSRACDGQDRLQ